MKKLIFIGLLVPIGCLDTKEESNESEEEGQPQGYEDEEGHTGCTNDPASDNPSDGEEEETVDDSEESGDPSDESASDPENDDPDSEDTSDPEESGTPNSPVAVCSVSPNPVNPPFDSSAWDGSESYDAGGGPLIYEWALISHPEGSAFLSFDSAYTSSAVMVNFMPDVAGEYLGRLTVTNEEGLSDTCDVLLEAVPSQNLWIEMSWEHSGDDMDLHLLSPSASADWNSAVTTDQDCYYANCTWSSPDWGQVGYAGDDPSLDLDDITNVGPEIIHISDPENSGLYTVVVHDNPALVYDGSNTVTVKIYLNGSLVWMDSKAISAEDSYTPFAQIDWSSNAVIPL
ncbi:MAG: hypothetical protein VX278_16915 [Myxococcota bacterium]|nr:hypothetical protein [Myxococcota bacterium]